MDIKRLIGAVSLFLIVLLGLRFTTALFSDSGQSTANTFQAAATFPTATPTPTTPITPTITPTPIGINPGDVVINEINWGGSNGDGNDEWIELKNMTGNTIDLSNWIVENLGTGSGSGANITIPAGKTIGPNGFFIISALNQAGSRINVASDVVNSSVSLNNGGEQLKLKTSANVLIDTANGTGAWFAGSGSTPKKSMERKNPPGDGSQAANWQTATTHTNMDGSGSTDEFGTPKAANGS